MQLKEEQCDSYKAPESVCMARTEWSMCRVCMARTEWSMCRVCMARTEWSMYPHWGWQWRQMRKKEKDMVHGKRYKQYNISI